MFTNPRVARDPQAPFQSAFDLERFLWDAQHEGRAGSWQKATRPRAHGTDNNVYIKRFLGVWYALIIPKSTWSSDVYLSPTKFPRNSPTSDPEWGVLRNRLTDRLSIKGLTLAALESRFTALAREYKRAAGARQPTDTSRWSYTDRQGERRQGPQALAVWKKDVEALLQEEIDRSGKHGMDWDTDALISNVLENYNREIEGASRKIMARHITAILASMAKRKLIERDTNDPRKPKWLSLGYVPKPRHSW